MNLKILGNSITAARSSEGKPLTFVDILFQRYGCHDEYTSYRSRARCSEERILYFLKKIPAIDVAIIFHGKPSHEFCPSCIDDFEHGTIDDDDVRYMTERKINRWFFEDIRGKIPMSISECKHAYDPITTRNMLMEHSRLFYNIDLQRNRYHGALLLIDQYLRYKSIRAIHCIDPKDIPTWFNFSSGIVESRFVRFQYDAPHSCSYSESENAITATGNQIIADALTEHIERLIRSD